MITEETKKNIEAEELDRLIKEVNKSPLCVLPSEEHVNKMVLTSDDYLDEVIRALLEESYSVNLYREHDEYGDKTIITWKDK